MSVREWFPNLGPMKKIEIKTIVRFIGLFVDVYVPSVPMATSGSAILSNVTSEVSMDVGDFLHPHYV